MVFCWQTLKAQKSGTSLVEYLALCKPPWNNDGPCAHCYAAFFLDGPFLCRLGDRVSVISI